MSFPPLLFSLLTLYTLPSSISFLDPSLLSCHSSSTYPSTFLPLAPSLLSPQLPFTALAILSASPTNLITLRQFYAPVLSLLYVISLAALTCILLSSRVPH